MDGHTDGQTDKHTEKVLKELDFPSFLEKETNLKEKLNVLHDSMLRKYRTPCLPMRKGTTESSGRKVRQSGICGKSLHIQTKP